jgi:TetR/AcrR family transcriptional regulator, cholesterol catabolism regulator
MARPSSRDAILRVFAEHVADRGYADTSLGDVAAELNLSKGTIVHHFGSKETLLGEVHVAYFSRRFAEAEHLHARLAEPAARLAGMMYSLLAAHRDDRAASLACQRELVRYFTGEWGDEVRAQRTRYTGIVIDILRAGVEQGTFHTPDATMSGLHIFGMCNYAWTWYRPEGPQSAEDIARLFAREVLGGLTHLSAAALDAEIDPLVDAAISAVRQTPGRLPPDGPLDAVSGAAGAPARRA